MNHSECKKHRVKALALAIGCALWQTGLSAQETATETSTDQDEPVVFEEIIVKGVRASQARAIEIKRDSANMVDSIVAEDIGKLPDATITDSLQRITGVQIKREANEGTSLNVRGMPQVLTTLNGEQFLSPWTITEVGANYGDIPAGMINGVNVYKSTSADMVAGGISGVIDLKTIAPLGLDEGWMARSKIEASSGSRSDRELQSDGSYERRNPDHDVSLIAGYNHDGKVAGTLGLFHNETRSASYQIQDKWNGLRLGFLDRQGGSPGDPVDLDNDGDLENDWYLTPQAFSANSNFMERERQGASGSLQIEFNENWEGRADVFYTRMDQYDRGVRAEFDARSSVDAYEVDGRPPSSPTDLYNVMQPGTVLGDSVDFSYVDANGVTQNATLHAVEQAHILASQFQSVSSSEINRTAAINSNFELTYNNNDNFEATLRYVHAEAEKQQRIARFQQGTPAWLWVDNEEPEGKDPLTTYDVVVDYSQDIPSFMHDADLSSTELLQMYQGDARGENTDATLDVLRLDGLLDLEPNGWFQSMSFGARYGVREADHSEFYYVTPTARYSNWDDPRVAPDQRFLLRQGNSIWQKYPEWRRFDIADEDQRLVTIGGLEPNDLAGTDIITYTDFGPIEGFSGGVSALNPDAWDDPLAFMNDLYPAVTLDDGTVLRTRTAEDPGLSYRVKEESSSIYGQVNFDSDDGLFGVPVSGNWGLRLLRIDREVEHAVVPEVLDRFNSIGYDPWQRIAFVSNTEIEEESFTELLPSFNINFHPAEAFIARFAAAKTVSRNNLENVGSSLVLWYSECQKLDENGAPVSVNGRTATVGCVGGGDDRGRPDIKPWEAWVYNTSAEWYFGENSVLAAGAFFFDIEESVEDFQEQRSFIDDDGIDRNRNANIWVTDNVGASDLYGLELAYKQPFSFFDNEYLAAFGTEINYTYSNSESNDVDIEGNALPLDSNSEHQANFILWYDKAGFNARLAYNWRSKEYLGRVGVNAETVPLNLGNWQEPTGYLDFSMSYWVNDNFSVFLNGTNLTEENQRSYAQLESQFHSLYVQERRIAIGVNLSL